MLLFSGIERPLTYSIPENLEPLCVGALVNVPVRSSNSCGVVVEIRPAESFEAQNGFRLRPLRSLAQPERVLTGGPRRQKLPRGLRNFNAAPDVRRRDYCRHSPRPPTAQSSRIHARIPRRHSKISPNKTRPDKSSDYRRPRKKRASRPAQKGSQAHFV